MSKANQGNRISILATGTALLLIICVPFSKVILDCRILYGNTEIPVLLLAATAIGIGSIGFWLYKNTQ